MLMGTNGRVILIITICLLKDLHRVDACTANIKSCRNHILVATFAPLGLCLLIAVILYKSCSFKKKRRNQKGSAYKGKDIEGRRNKVFEDDSDIKEDDEYPNGRKRQDSGFVASSNESIVPLPEMYATSPRKSPSMPNLSVRAFDHSSHEDVFPPVPPSTNTQTNKTLTKQVSKPKMVSIGVSTEDLNTGLNEPTSMSSAVHQDNEVQRKPETVLVQKKTSNCTGIDFAIGGVYVKDFNTNEIAFKKGTLAVGDEIVSLNDYPVNGLNDLEVFSFFAKLGAEVKMKVNKARFLTKAESMSTCSSNFAMSDTSSMTQEIPQVTEFQTHNNNPDRLPRVIFDANNASIDMTMTDYTKTNPKKSQSVTHAQVHKPRSNTGESITGDITNQISNQNKYNSTIFETQQSQQNGESFSSTVANSTNLYQEISKILSANPEMFMEFLASMKTNGRCSNNHNSSRCSSDMECCAHSRNVSSEGSKHCRHCSDDKCRHPRHISGSDVTKHKRNTSSESSRVNRLIHDEYDNSNLSRTSSEEQIRHSVYANGVFPSYRSLSGDANSQIFTIDSHKRQMENRKNSHLENIYHTSQIDTQTHTTTPTQHLQYPLINDTFVAQQAYNSDYVVGASGNYTEVTYTKPNYRSNKDGSPVVFSNQNIPRFSLNQVNSADIISSSTEYRQVVTSNSPQNSFNTMIIANGHHRKPPPEYSAVVRPQSDPTVTEPANIEYDAEIMRKMTQKYSEPRFRKDPPPYPSKSINNSSNSSDSTIVVRRRSKDYKPAGNRSRPHSYTETGVLGVAGLMEDSAVQKKQIKPTKNRENRNYPKRTHSMPAVKYAEMRPVAAQAFLHLNNSSYEDQKTTSQQSIPMQQFHMQQQPQQSVPQQQFLQQQQIIKQMHQQVQHSEQQPLQQLDQQFSDQQKQIYLEQQMLERQEQYREQLEKKQQILEQQLLEQHQLSYIDQPNNQQYQDGQIMHQEGDHQQDQSPQAQQNEQQQLSPYEKVEKRVPKKQSARQKAQDNINRRKSIDSGTLRQLAEEIKENPALGGDIPIISQLLGEASEKRAQGLYRYKSTEALFSQF